MENTANCDFDIEAGQTGVTGRTSQTHPSSFSDPPRDSVPSSPGAYSRVRRILANAAALAATAFLTCYASGSLDFLSSRLSIRALGRFLVSVLFQFVALLTKDAFTRYANCL